MVDAVAELSGLSPVRTGLYFRIADVMESAVIILDDFSTPNQLGKGQIFTDHNLLQSVHYTHQFFCLQSVLRWNRHSRIEQTMVYAHFAPECLQDAVLLNPLKGGTDVQSIHIVSTVR